LTLSKVKNLGARGLVDFKSEVFIWTEAINCGEILTPFVRSFLQHHDYKIYIFGLGEDLKNMETSDQLFLVALDNRESELLIPQDDSALIVSKFQKGHSGTAALWSSIISHRREEFLIHLDADSVFLGNVIDPILAPLRDGYSIAGPRRLYREHPGRLNLWRKVVYRFHRDAVQTYAFGFNRTDVNIDQNKLERLINGEGKNQFYSRLFPILDFFDRVTFYLARKKSIFYFSPPGIDPKYANKECDCIERNLISFFAVGSGCAFYYGRALSSSLEYMEIAKQSFATFASYFLDIKVKYSQLELPELEEKLKRLDKKTWTLRRQF